jgi:hypothetical protein
VNELPDREVDLPEATEAEGDDEGGEGEGEGREPVDISIDGVLEDWSVRGSSHQETCGGICDGMSCTLQFPFHIPCGLQVSTLIKEQGREGWDLSERGL